MEKPTVRQFSRREAWAIRRSLLRAGHMVSERYGQGASRLVQARRMGWGGRLVRRLALLFVVQRAALAVSQGVSADAMRGDQFGNVLRLASADMSHGGARGQADRHAEMMDRCSPGCGTFAGRSVPVPQATKGRSMRTRRRT